MREIKEMSVLVTGGGSGIGEATARLFAQRGAKVTITGRRLDKIEAVAASIGPACRAVVGDVTQHADREAMLAAAVAHGGKLDVLVSNAANMYRQAVGQYTEDFLKEAFNTNVISGMMLSSMAVPLLEATQGAIIFLGSIHNRRAYPGASPYATTKAAVEGLTRVMAAELGRRQIRVCCVLPGAVSTEINLHAPALLPDDYCGDVHLRLSFYKKLATAKTTDQIDALLEEIVDRFGKLPPQGQTLIDVHRLRVIAKPYGVVKVDAAPGVINITFKKDPPIDSMAIMHLIQKNRHIKLAGNDKLRVEKELPEAKDRAQMVRDVLRSLGQPKVAETSA